MSTLQDLIARLEGANEGAKALDYAIAKAAGVVPKEWLDDFPPGLLAYTSSLDAVLTLVPEKMWWEVGRVQEPTSPMRHFGSARVHMATVSHYGEKPYNGHHDQPAIALCIAALRARLSSQQKDTPRHEA